MNVEYRPMKKQDWISVAEIYRQGIETGNATFQKEIPPWDDWNSAHLKNCRFVADIDNEIVVWAALTPSLKIHENRGFRKVGFREKIGRMDGI